MFQGTIPQAVRQILAETCAGWDVKDVAVACSGNLTVERVLANQFSLHSCDVSIYSCALGSHFAGQPMRLAVRDDYAESLPWLASRMGTPEDRLATLLLASNFAQALDSQGRLKPNAYYRRVMEGYARQWPELVDQTAGKLAACELRLSSFNAGDAAPWLEGLSADYGVVSYPPFWADGYEAMFKRLDLLFDWDKPTYDMLEGDRMTAFLHRIADRRCWTFGLPVKHPDFTDHLRGFTQTTKFGVPIYVYGSRETRRVVAPGRAYPPAGLRRLGQGEALDGALRIAPLAADTFNALRATYLNPAIKPAAPTLAVGVWVGEVLVGAFAFGSQKSYSDADTVYLLSDFAVAPTDYPRLSKLVLMAALSRESQILAERMTRHRVRRIMTTAFTQNPVSMKYRGLFSMVSRKENADWREDAADTSQMRYMLNYIADCGRWTLAEGLETWLKKHASKSA
ncbi:MAG: hypothetical protein MUF38_16605 [Anaerolineae bacterium]|nr:hypothetical protein [Anaerolineae bacterium]